MVAWGALLTSACRVLCIRVKRRPGQLRFRLDAEYVRSVSPMYVCAITDDASEVPGSA